MGGDVQSTLLHERELEQVDVESLPPMLRFGGARLAAQGGLILQSICKEGFNCDAAASTLLSHPIRAITAPRLPKIVYFS